MAVVFLALGSNVGNSLEYIAQAIQAISTSVTITKKAPIYTSSAVGVTDQPDFYNTAVTGTTDLTPEELLRFVKGIEQEIGRIERFRWGPREIDIDIIFYGDRVIDTPTLTIPHPRFAEREFVLHPITDMSPDFVDPKSDQTVRTLLERLPDADKSILKRL